MTELLIASGNAHKVEEIRSILAGLPLRVLSLKDLPTTPEEPVEDGDSFAANAEIKARGYGTHFEGWVLADDSGVVVPALGGAPGIHSARYAGNHGDDLANRRKLQGEVDALGGSADAHFVCSLCLCRPGLDAEIFESRWHGEIFPDDRGDNGFGYDPMFQPQGETRRAAQMSDEEKNKCSHRAQALASFRTYLEKTPC